MTYDTTTQVTLAKSNLLILGRLRHRECYAAVDGSREVDYLGAYIVSFIIWTLLRNVTLNEDLFLNNVYI